MISRSRPTARRWSITAPPERDEAWSTNYDLCRVPIAGGTPQNLTAGNLAADSWPTLQPRRQVAGLSAQKRPGYEADRWELMVMPAGGGTARSLTDKLDRSIDDFVWSADSDRRSIARPSKTPRAPIFKLSVKDGKVAPFVSGGTFAALSISARRQATGLHASRDDAAAGGDAGRLRRARPAI